MSRQIMISDRVYDQLNDLRRHKGNKFSFNTVIQNLIRLALQDGSSNEMYTKMQWHAIRELMSKLHTEGYIRTDLLQYSHVLRMVANGEINECIEYLKGQFETTDADKPPTRLRL